MIMRRKRFSRTKRYSSSRFKSRSSRRLTGVKRLKKYGNSRGGIRL